MKYTFFIFLFLWTVLSMGQNLICTTEDSLAFHSKIKELENIRCKSYGDSIVAIGKTFLGTPYVANTLDLDLEESLIVNLRGLDCTTFVENVLVFNILLSSENPSFEHYISLLENLRYRNGKRKGYASRLHYFSEWLKENEKKGWIEDIGPSLGGTSEIKKLNFMSSHRTSYKQLAVQKNYEAIADLEKGLDNSLCVVSQEALATNEKLLQNGDIIALATNIEGLDVTHTGISIRQKNGRVHLLHASVNGGVEISEKPLVEYLRTIKHNIGVLVARPLEPR